MRNIKRFLPVLLVLALLLAFVPTFGLTALADNSNPTDLLILGDSISTGYGLDSPETDSYGAQLAAAFDLTAPAYDNQAVDGATSAELAAALQDPAAAELLAAHDTVVMSIGGNDVLAPFFAIAKEALGLDADASNTDLQAAIAADPDAIAEITAALSEGEAQFTQVIGDFAANLAEIMTAIKTAAPEAQIYIQTIYNPFSGVPGFETFSAVADAVITQMNEVISGGAAEFGYTVVDIYSAFEGEAAALTNIASFDIHPNADGHTVIFQAVYDEIIQPEGGEPDITPPPAEWQNPFSDVQDSDWFSADVAFVASTGLMNGVSDTLFAPGSPVSRGMVVTVLYRLAGSPDVGGLTNDFTDVADGQYYTDAVMWAGSVGIVSGYGDGAFGPNDPVTREQMATILYRYIVMLGEGPQGAWMTRLDFTDAASVSDWAVAAVTYLNMQGVITGNPDGTFNPAGQASRAEFAAMLHRLAVAIAEQELPDTSVTE